MKELGRAARTDRNTCVLRPGRWHRVFDTGHLNRRLMEALGGDRVSETATPAEVAVNTFGLSPSMWLVMALLSGRLPTRVDDVGTARHRHAHCSGHLGMV